MERQAGPGLWGLAGALVRSPRLYRAVSFPFRLGPADPGWRKRPFFGLSVVNNLSSAGDALVTVALAGSVFVSVSLNAARTRTALGLVCTVLPFAVVGPLIGPSIDRLRGGRRVILLLTAVGRLAACLMMASWIHSLLLFPAAFLSLVCSKTHAIAKAALVPGVVDDEEDLVRANSRLTVGGSLVTSLAAGVGGAVYKLFSARALLDLDVVVFATLACGVLYLLRDTPEPVLAVPGVPAAAFPEPAFPEPAFPEPGFPEPAFPRAGGAGPAFPSAGGAGPAFRWADGPPEPGCFPPGTGRAPKAPPRPAPAATPSGRNPLWRRRSGPPPFVPRSLVLAQVAMAGMRAASGFLTLLVIFGFRHDGAALYWYGLAAGSNVAGNFGGALLAPRLNSRIHERLLVGGAAVLIAVTAVVVSFMPLQHRLPAAVILSGVVAFAASLAKTAFDAIVQRDTLDCDRSRLFARFESIFQLVWVGGALLPTLIALPLLAGFVLVAAVVVSTSTVFVAGLARERSVRGQPVSRPSAL